MPRRPYRRADTKADPPGPRAASTTACWEVSRCAAGLMVVMTDRPFRAGTRRGPGSPDPPPRTSRRRACPGRAGQPAARGHRRADARGVCRFVVRGQASPGCVDGRQVLVPVTGDVYRDLRGLPWAGAAAATARPRLANPCRAWRPGPFSSRACAVLASLADLQADGPAPSWLVRVGTCLALHFPGGSLRLCPDRPGLLIGELGRRLFAILPGPAAKQAHSAAKKTHSVIIGRRLADFSHLGLRGRSAGRSRRVSCLPACRSCPVTGVGTIGRSLEPDSGQVTASRALADARQSRWTGCHPSSGVLDSSASRWGGKPFHTDAPAQ
jgi:hypothetical protein